MKYKKNAKKIVHFKPSGFLHLSENWIYDQIKDEKEYQTIVYTEHVLNNDIFPVLKIRNFPDIHKKICLKNILDKISNKLFGFKLTVLICLFWDKPAIIMAHFGIHGYDFLPYLKFFKKPLITRFYGYDLSMLPKTKIIWQKKYKKLFNYGDGFLVEGEQMKKKLAKLGCPPEKIFVHHLGVDLDKIKFKKREIKNNEDICILLAGRFTEKKGFPCALEGIGIYLQNNKEDKIKITIMGKSNGKADEKEEEKIRKILKKYNLEEITTFLGFETYPNFIENLYKNHIFISPSITALNGDDEGGVPVSIIAATASGMPVISTYHCDIPEVIINGKNGFLVREKNSEDISLTLGKLIKEQSQWGRIGYFGHKHIENNYNNKKQIKKLEEIYCNFLNCKRDDIQPTI